MTSTLLLLGGTLTMFAGAALALVVLAPASADRRAVARSLAAIRTMNCAPERAHLQPDRSFVERVLDPLAQRLLGLDRLLTPGDVAGRMRKSLDRAGNPPAGRWTGSWF